jgi:chromate reductase, NAD(P)H dehydrogenase (quinone)
MLSDDKLIVQTMQEPRDRIRVLGISGSGRKDSYNTALLEAARELAPGSIIFDTFDISELPLFNQDLERSLPAIVVEFKREIKKADAILFAVPEHNYTITAVMKNAIEWGNRPAGDNSWDGKPAAIISASSGPRGGVRAQLHLRQIMVDLNMFPINRPLLLVANEEDKFDLNMKLTDPQIRETLRKTLVVLEEWTRRLQPRVRRVPV